MSWSAIRGAYAPKGLTTAQRIVLVTLAYRCNSKTGQCNPSMGSLARDTGLTERGVRLAIRSLENAGILLTNKSDGGRMRTNHYRINPELSSPFESHKPGTQFRVSKAKPGTERPKTRNQATENPELSSSEPLRTVRNQGEARDTRSEEEIQINRQKLAEVKKQCGLKRP